MATIPCKLHSPLAFHIPRKPRARPPSRLNISAEKRSNLDHLQRSSHPQPNSKKTTLVAPPGLWDRFPTARTVQQMMDTMERMMDDDPFAVTSNPVNGREGYGKGRTPWAIKEREEDYKMRFDMPGMTKEDVKVWVEEKMLVVRAAKHAKMEEGEDQDEKADPDTEEWHPKSYGKYNCRIALPENIEFEKIAAEVKDGVLYITIPKAKLATKVIDINVK